MQNAADLAQLLPGSATEDLPPNLKFIMVHASVTLTVKRHRSIYICSPPADAFGMGSLQRQASQGIVTAVFSTDSLVRHASQITFLAVDSTVPKGAAPSRRGLFQIPVSKGRRAQHTSASAPPFVEPGRGCGATALGWVPIVRCVSQMAFFVAVLPPREHSLMHLTPAWGACSS